MIARISLRVVLLLLLVMPLSIRSAQGQEPDNVKAQLDSLKAQLAATRVALQRYMDETDAQLDATRDSIRGARMGSTRFVVTGYGQATFESEEGSKAFSSGFSPVLLWQLSERLLFSAEPEFTAGEETETELEYAHVSYLVSDWLTIGGGKFLTPFGQFVPRLHPAWINKLPDAPLTFAHDIGLAPISAVGAYARGGFLLGEARANYAVYAINGPEMVGAAVDGEMSEGGPGLIRWPDFNKEHAYGGRAGLFFLRAGLELGYSYQSSNLVHLSGVDASVSRTGAAGMAEMRAEVMRSDVSNTGPFMTDNGEKSLVNNKRSGGYVQCAYQPTYAQNGMRNLQAVFRYDWMNRPDWQDGMPGNNTKRYNVGLVYLVAPSMQIKAAFQHELNSQADGQNRLLIQLGTGF